MDSITIGKENHIGYQLPLYCHDHGSFLRTVDENSQFKLILIENGVGSLILNQCEETYAAPVLLCMNEKDVLHVTHSSNFSIKAVYFHPSVINHGFDNQNIRHPQNFTATEDQDRFLILPFITPKSTSEYCMTLDPSYARKITDLITSMKEELEGQSDQGWPCRSRSWFLELLILVTRLSRATSSSTKQPQADDNRMTEIIDYLQTHYREKILVNDLAKKFNLNRTTLNLEFSRKTQLSIIDYLIKLRIQVASTFIRDTLLNIGEIMERVGFTNHTHFWRMFKKVTGLSPSEYRHQFCWLNRSESRF